jgi:uncharacterized protein (TIGR01244 family)
MTNFVRVTDQFSVAQQLSAEDFAAAAAAGFTLVVNNRPDGEQPGQLTSAEAEAAARAAGLAYRAAPVSGMPSEQTVEAMAALFDEHGGPILAYCRSGTRSITTWALAQALRGAVPAQELVQAAADAGYDLSALAPVLQRLSGEAG